MRMPAWYRRRGRQSLLDVEPLVMPLRVFLALEPALLVVAVAERALRRLPTATERDPGLVGQGEVVPLVVDEPHVVAEDAQRAVAPHDDDDLARLGLGGVLLLGCHVGPRWGCRHARARAKAGVWRAG